MRKIILFCIILILLLTKLCKQQRRVAYWAEYLTLQRQGGWSV